MCVFCNQRSISGCREFDISEVRRIIESSLSTATADDEVEIAFFGGSFTGIDRSLMLELLSIADEYVRSGRVTSLRCSTRPDYIDPEIISILQSYNVRTVELGLQSMVDSVLSASRRGHTARDAERAAKLIKAAGLDLIGQMMIGLPAADPESEVYTAHRLCELGCDGARVYPTVVFYGTELSSMSERGEYRALDLEDAIARTASVLDVFDRASLPVIRVGLCASEDLSDPESVMGGASHPAIGELSMGELFFRRISEAIDAYPKEALYGRDVTVFVPKGATSRAVGQKRRNILRLNQKYCAKNQINRIKILEKSDIIGYNIIISIL